MPLNFAKKPATAASAAPAAVAAKPAATTSAKAVAAATVHHKPAAPKAAGFMKVGSAAKQLLQQEEAAAEARRAEQGKLRRFFVSSDKGAEKLITFMDGELDEDGMLAIPMYHEHEIRAINGDRTRYVCLKSEDPNNTCPICDAGESSPYLVGLLTVIDHTGYTSSKGKNAGTKHTNVKYLYAAKRETIGKLTKLAAKRGGLTGCTFEVSRDGDRSAAVGSTFEFVEKHASLAHAHAKHGGKIEDYAPADYAEEIKAHTAEELIELGVGKAFSGVGTAAKKDLHAQL